MARQAIIKNGAFFAVFSKRSVNDLAGPAVAVGDAWEEYARDNLQLELLPMEEPASASHVVPRIEDGVVKWSLPE